MRALPFKRLMLDGEAVAHCLEGLPDFHRLLGDDGQATACFYAFDLLWLEAQDLRGVELIGRRRVLQKALKKAGPVLRFSEHLAADQGEAMFRHACALGLEGIVSKKLTSRYKSGACRSWLRRRDGMKTPRLPNKRLCSLRNFGAGEGIRTLAAQRGRDTRAQNYRPADEDRTMNRSLDARLRNLETAHSARPLRIIWCNTPDREERARKRSELIASGKAGHASAPPVICLSGQGNGRVLQWIGGAYN
jgi:hypothetical protein